MIYFAQAQYLLLLLLVPVFLIVYGLVQYGRTRRIRKFGDEALVQQLMPSYSKTKGWVGMILFSLAFMFFSIGLARPQIGAKLKEHQSKGAEVMIALDVSNSMLAQDYSPDRLQRAKLAISRLVDKLNGDRIGLVLFAGTSFVQLPITTDYVSAKMFLGNISTESVPVQGTAIGDAINTCIKSFSAQSENSRAIIVITDGENHEGGAEEAAKAAAKAGINVYVIGVGTTQGSEIPTANGPLTDANGQVVHTALNEQMCRDIAQAGKGLYLHLDQSNSAQDELQAQLKQLKQSTTTTSYTARNEQFQAVALIALLLLIIEACINDTKNAFFNKFKIFNK